MALFPCDSNGHRYPGPQQTIYPAVVLGNESTRRKLRYCPGHFEAMLDHLKASCENAQMSLDDDRVVRCALCSRPVTDGTAQFFATVYAKGEERADYWAPLHEDCVPGQLEDWKLPVDMP